MARKVILVVENDEGTIRSLVSALASHYNVLCASHGEKAISLAEEKYIHLALIARSLPDIEGLQLMEKMVAQFPTLPLIFVAENASKDLIVGAFRRGAKDFLEKPIVTNTLLERVHRTLASTEQDNDSAHRETLWLAAFKRLMCDRVLPKMRPWRKHIRAFGLHSITKLLASKNRAWSSNGESAIPLRSFGESSLQRQNSAKFVGMSPDSAPAYDGDTASAPLLRVHCFGRFLIFLNDQPADRWPCRKEKDVFAYLVVNHTKRIHREILMDHFWPASTPASARNSLNVAMHGIRSRLRRFDTVHEYLLYSEECYFINPEIELWLDIEEFQHYWRLAQTAEREKKMQLAVANYELAAALYHGDFMEEDAYESWPTQQRENLKEIYLVILDRLGDYYALDGHPDTAITLCDRILERDNCREDVYRRLMRCYYRLGQRDKALRIFKKCTEALKKELETEPTRATTQLYEQVKQDCLKKT